MIVKISPSKIEGKITIPSSKSVAHRVLIASFLSGEKTEIMGTLNAGDIITTCGCLSSLGAVVNINDDKTRIEISAGGKKSLDLDALDSGSTLRFLLPVCAALGEKCYVHGTKRLSNRPIDELLRTLGAHGAKYSSLSLPLEISGKLTSGDYEIDGSISSQFITGLMFALPILDGDSKIIVKNQTVSAAYIDITLDVLSGFGIKIEKTNYGYFILGGQKYKSVKSMTVESDWSSACFMACLGAVGGNVDIFGLRQDSAQGDKVVVDLLKLIGAKASWSNDVLNVSSAKLKPIEFNAENCPDIVPVLAACLAFADGKSVITGVERLKIKESDRIAETIRLLQAFGIKAEYTSNALVIYGGTPKGCSYHSPDDHRLAMSAAVLASYAQGDSVIEGAECVKKSYPDFFKHFSLLGGKVDVQSV